MLSLFFVLSACVLGYVAYDKYSGSTQTPQDNRTAQEREFARQLDETVRRNAELKREQGRHRAQCVELACDRCKRIFKATENEWHVLKQRLRRAADARDPPPKVLCQACEVLVLELAQHRAQGIELTCDRCERIFKVAKYEWYMLEQRLKRAADAREPPPIVLCRVCDPD